MNAVKKFKEMINQYSYKNFGRGEGPLTNITFFFGAGFSKSWDKEYPLCDELFSFIPHDYSSCYAVNTFLNDCGIDTHKTMTLQAFSESYYKLLMMGKYDFLQGRYYDDFNISAIDREIRYIIYSEFTKKIELNFSYDGCIAHPTITESQKEIINFFYELMDHLTGDSLYPEGLRLNYITTNYDFIIEGIIDTILQPDDFHYIHTYRGFTADKINEYENISYLHQEDLVYRLIKLNGGFEIFESGNLYNIDYRKISLSQIKENPPLLILPSKEQNYDNNYFNTIFKKAVRCMNESTVLVIVGYGFSEEDSVIRLLLNNFAESKRDVASKNLFYIDLAEKEIMRSRVQQVFPNKEYVRSFDSYFSGSFASFCRAFNSLK